MDPLTHALTSYALARAALPKPARGATLLVVVAGLAPDLDMLSNLAGPSAALRLGGAVTHSFLGAGAVTLLLAICFRAWQRKRPSDGGSFLSALGLASLGVAAHVLLDLTNSNGVALLWPFRTARTAWNFNLLLDPILLGMLLFTLLLPGLFRMVNEEIGARTEGRAGRGWSMVALAFLALFCASRFFLQQRAVILLGANLYHDRAPLHAGAFPDSANPFHWLGAVETEVSIEEVEVRVGPGAEFNPDRSRTYYKPEASPALDAARAAPVAARFLTLARFPSASITRTADGFRVDFRDIGLSSLRNLRGYYFAQVELDAQARVLREELEYERERVR
jgi:membrane-bound metal-dependent hydrolase YbcI (DUF457 family)